MASTAEILRGGKASGDGRATQLWTSPIDDETMRAAGAAKGTTKACLIRYFARLGAWSILLERDPVTIRKGSLLWTLRGDVATAYRPARRGEKLLLLGPRFNLPREQFPSRVGVVGTVAGEVETIIVDYRAVRRGVIQTPGGAPSIVDTRSATPISGWRKARERRWV